MLKSLNKEVNFLGEPMKVWEIPVSCIIISFAVILGGVLFVMMMIVGTLLWIIFPPFRSWIDDSVEDIVG